MAYPSVPGIEILGKLGSGAFGNVFRGQWLDDLLPTAVKVLDEADDDALDRFHREANLLKALRDSPHVVDVYAWDMDAKPPWMSMELCEGSLEPWTRPGHRKPLKTVLVALAHAATGLRDLHAEGGFHRDIKPANILVARTEDGAPQIKVGDFGLARSPLVDESTITRLGHGTPSYMAPELQRYRDAAGPACDVYSLGVTGIHLLTGSTDLGSVAAVQKSRRLRELLTSMVAMDPRDRPEAGEALAEMVALIEKMSIKPRKPQTRSSRNARRRTTNGNALAGILLGALAVGAGAVALGALLDDD